MIVADRAFARADDPETSHAAANSLGTATIRASQGAVLRCLQAYGPLHDEALITLYKQLAAASREEFPPQSASGIRTRRKELERLSLVRQAGETRTDSNRRTIVWRSAAGVAA